MIDASECVALPWAHRQRCQWTLTLVDGWAAEPIAKADRENSNCCSTEANRHVGLAKRGVWYSLLVCLLAGAIRNFLEPGPGKLERIKIDP